MSLLDKYINETQNIKVQNDNLNKYHTENINNLLDQLTNNNNNNNNNKTDEQNVRPIIVRHRKPSSSAKSIRRKPSSMINIDVLEKEITILQNENDKLKMMLNEKTELLNNKNNNIQDINNIKQKYEDEIRKLKLEQNNMNQCHNEDIQSLREEIRNLNQECEQLKRSEKDKLKEARVQTTRLNRALHEIEKQREIIENLQREQNDSDSILKDEVMKQKAEISVLKEHKKDLLDAFRKQAKLIDVLKRQRIHMEASKMLSFTEDKLARALEFSTS